MAKLINASNRQLIPRWHTSRKIGFLQQADSPGLPEESNGPLFRIEEKKRAWESNPSTSSAIDLFVGLKSANFTLDPLYKQTKNYLLAKQGEVSSAVIDYASPKLRKIDASNRYTTNKNQVFEIIRTLKRFATDCPHDALTWNDLAFYYAIIGERDKAKHCMEIAYNLKPNHPFIARSYSRLLIHFDKPDEALHILRKTGQVKSHPEILSADISIRATFDIGRPDVSAARRLIDKYSNRPSVISELSASIGTLEIANGSIKTGKSHLITSSIAPTENTVAQLKWIFQQHEIATPINNTSLRSLEADAISYYNKKNYSHCRESLMTLHEFQPFSEGAIADAGYISLIALDDPEFICDFADNVGNVVFSGFSAKNNYIVAKMLLGSLDGVDKMLLGLARSTDDTKDKAVLSATLGMYLYSIGDIEGGREQYANSNTIFKAMRDHFSLSMSLLHQGMIERQLGIDSARSILELAKKEAKKVIGTPELKEKIDRELIIYESLGSE